MDPQMDTFKLKKVQFIIPPPNQRAIKEKQDIPIGTVRTADHTLNHI